MLAWPPGREANSDVSAPLYTRHRPRLHGRDCSRQSPAFPPLHMDVQVPRSTGQGLLLQSFCIPAIHGGQMQEVGQCREQLPRKPKPRGPSGHREDSDPPRQQRPFHRYRALAAVPGAAPERFVRLIHLVPLRSCAPQRRGAVVVAPMAGELAACADVWEFSRPARPDDRRHYLEAPVDG